MPGKQFFIEDEKDIMTKLVQKYKALIENKKLDTISQTNYWKEALFQCKEWGKKTERLPSNTLSQGSTKESFSEETLVKSVYEYGP